MSLVPDDLLAGVRAVVFDVGGVFLLPSPHHFGPALAEMGVVTSDHEADWHRAHYVATAALDGAIADGASPEAAWHAYLSGYAGVVAPGAALAPEDFSPLWEGPAIERWSWPQPSAVAALRRLVDAEWPVAIVSNADGTVEESLRARGVCQVGAGAGACVLTVVDSHVHGVHKPDPAVFAPALEALAPHGATAADCLYVGDTRAADVVGARAAGMRPVQLDPYDLYRDADHHRVRSVADLVDAVIARH